MLFDESRGETERAEEVSNRIIDLCLDHGGSITGEHGVGHDKKVHMGKMFNEIDLDVMQLVRCAFDPAGICNPGKIFPTPRLCGERPGRARGLHPLAGVRRGRCLLRRLLRQVSPTSIDELSHVLADATPPVGSSGCAAAAQRSAGRLPACQPTSLIDTRGLDRIVEHAAGDLVVTAQAGVTLAALQDHVASSAQWLALDPPEPGATLGGVIATAASGPRRLLYGTPRDLLIGITVVLADGTIAHSGGKVVKNVAGYDLGKLFTGSFGTLGVIAQCTFRLHPLPVDRRVVRAGSTIRPPPCSWCRRSGAVPCAIEWDGATLTVVIESLESAAQVQAEEVAAVIGGDIGAAAAGRLRRSAHGGRARSG